MADARPSPVADRGPFVGRDVERARIVGALDRARTGSGGLVLVGGPAGIGKTRTVEESLDGAPSAVVWGRCVDDPGAPPLWPWRRVLRARPEVATAVGDALAAVDRTPDAADPEVARFRFVSAATEALVASAEGGGLVVVLEDLHWADPTSLRLLRHLAGELHRSSLLVLGTYRDPAGPRGAPVVDALPDLLRWPGTELLELGPLAEEDVRSYLAAVAPAPPAPATVSGVHRRSGGNPLYLRALTAGGVDPSPGDGPASAALRHAVRSALAALPRDVVDLLTVAAVLGEEVHPALLAAVAGRPDDEVRAALDSAVRAGVLTAVPGAPGRRRFAHAVVRDGIYADLAPSAREALHRRIAEAWEATVGVEDATAGVVAGHWLRASADPDALTRAAGWARRASAAATRSLAFEEAAAFLRTALDAAERAGCADQERAELLVEVAATEFRAGRFAESLAHAVAASESAGAQARPDLLVAAALAVHDVGAPAFPPAVIAMCERALACPGLSPVVRARLLAQMASFLADAGRLGASSELSTAALELAEGTGDPEAILDAVRARMKVSVDALPPPERLRLGRLAIEHAVATGQPLMELWGAKWRIDAALETGDVATTEEELARISALARRTGLPLVRWHELRLRASVAALVGRFPEALALNARARDLGARELAQDVSTAGMSGAFALQHALITGDMSSWDDADLHLLDLADDIPIVLVSRALVAFLRGDRDDARVRYEDVRRRLADPDFAASSGVPTNLVPLVEAFRDPDTAEILAGLIAAHPVAAGGAGVYCCASMAGLLGRLEVVRGRVDEAVACFEEALAVDTATGARPAVVHDRLGLADALLRRGRHDDLSRAGELARAARQEAAGLGMPGPARTAARHEDAAARARRAADPLTGREREIAELVAAALTNRQIAERLVLSERTVESHVRNILTKLGAANRTEIALLAADRS